MPGLTRVCVVALGLLLGSARSSVAQVGTQAWTNLTFDWGGSQHLSYEFDIEPKALMTRPEGEPDWWNVDVTPAVTYGLKRWLDLTGEFATGFTRQTDDLNSAEATLRVGVTWHLLSREVPTLVNLRHLPPKRRLVLRDTMRVEQRNLFYKGDTPSSHTVRFRNRIEVQFPLNRPRMSDPGARYVLADWELFMPLGDPDERFASKDRTRVGFGYRRNQSWRYEVLYIWNRARNTIDEDFHTKDHIIDVRFRKSF